MNNSQIKLIIQRGHKRTNFIGIVVIITLLLFVTQFYSYVNWGSITKGGGLNFVVTAILLIATINRKKKGVENFSLLILCLITWPFLSSFVSLSIYGQPLIVSFRVLVPNLMWLFYFVLNRYHFQEKTVIMALLVYSIGMLLIMVIQQFTYPTAYFGIFNDDQMLEKGYSESAYQRNSIYRFLMHQNGYTAVPVLLFYLNVLKYRFSAKNLIIVIMMLVAVYMSLTRQVIASTAFVVLFSVLINKRGKIKVSYLLIISALVAIIYVYSNLLFEEMVENTDSELHKDYIRFQAYAFYWYKATENIWTFIAGHGLAASGYFQFLFNHWQEDLKLYSCDVGIIGIWFHYGMIYVFLYLYSLYLIFKYRKHIPIYVILFVVFAGLMSIMIFPFWITPKYYLVWTMIFYICDLHINKSPLRQLSIRQ